MPNHAVLRRLNQIPLALAVAVGGLLASTPAMAAPPTREACTAAHGASQELRLSGRLLEARAELRVCAESACPELVRTDCAAWLVDTEHQIPSFVVELEADSGEPKGARVFVDGQLLEPKADGSAYERDPGIHQFRFELDGYPPIEDSVNLRADERRRVIQVRFEHEAPKSDALGASGLAQAPPSTEPSGPRPIPVSTYVFGGVALAAAGVAGYFGVRTLGDYSERKDGCAPNCSDSEIQRVKSGALITDVTGGAAILSAGLATYFYLTRPVRPEHKEETPPSRSEGLGIFPNRYGFGVGYHAIF